MTEFSGTFLEIAESIDTGDNRQDNDPPVFLHPFRHGNNHFCECGQVGAKTLEQICKHRHHKDQQDRCHNKSHHDHRDRVGQGFFDFFLHGLGFFLVGGDFVQQGFQYPRMFARLNQITKQLVKIEGSSFEGFS